MGTTIEQSPPGYKLAAVEYTSPIRIQIAKGFEGEGREGWCFGTLVPTTVLANRWAIVKFDDEDDPTTFKASGLMKMKAPEWIAL